MAVPRPAQFEAKPQLFGDPAALRLSVWPAEGHKRVFVYLQPGAPIFERVAERLAESGHSVLWVAPGVTANAARRFESAQFKFMREPVRLSDAAEQADVALLHGGHGTVSAMLLAGVPVAVFPLHAEQGLIARNVERMGAGIAASVTPDAREVETLLERILTEPRYTQHAESFAACYRLYDPRETVSRIAQRIGRYCAS